MAGIVAVEQSRAELELTFYFSLHLAIDLVFALLLLLLLLLLLFLCSFALSSCRVVSCRSAHEIQVTPDSY